MKGKRSEKLKLNQMIPVTFTQLSFDFNGRNLGSGEWYEWQNPFHIMQSQFNILSAVWNYAVSNSKFKLFNCEWWIWIWRWIFLWQCLDFTFSIFKSTLDFQKSWVDSNGEDHQTVISSALLGKICLLKRSTWYICKC